MREKRKARVRFRVHFRGRRETKKKPNWKIIKISNTRATVTVYICTDTVAIVYKYTILHQLMWVFFWSKCVK